MLSDHPFEAPFHLPGQRVVGGARVRVLGMTADRGDLAAIKHRDLGGHPLEGTVGVPQAIGEAHQANPVVRPLDPIVEIQIGEVLDPARGAGPVPLAIDLGV